jgi:hypothetical protein
MVAETGDKIIPKDADLEEAFVLADEDLNGSVRVFNAFGGSTLHSSST